MSANSCPLISDNTAAPGTETLCWSTGGFANITIEISGIAGGAIYDVVANPGSVILQTITVDGVYPFVVSAYSRVCLVIDTSGTGNATVNALLFNKMNFSENACSIDFDATTAPVVAVNCWDVVDFATFVLEVTGLAGGAEYEIQANPGGVVLQTITVDGSYIFDVSIYAEICVVLTVSGTGTTSFDAFLFTVIGTGTSHNILLDNGPPSDDHPQYHTDERADDRTAVFFQDVPGLAWAYDDGANTFTPVLAPQLAHYLDLPTAAFFWSDFGAPTFQGQDGPFSAVPAAGGGLVNTNALHTDHPGIWCLSTGAASAVGRIFVLTSFNLGIVHFGVGNEVRCVSWIRTEPNLSTALQRYHLRSGFSSAVVPSAIIQGITFEYADNENGGRWQAITHDGVETSTDTGITVAANTWYKLEIIVNAAGTSVEFFIDDVSVAVNTTNIPTGTGVDNFHSDHIFKLIGTAARTMYLDACAIYVSVNR